MGRWERERWRWGGGRGRGGGGKVGEGEEEVGRRERARRRWRGGRGRMEGGEVGEGEEEVERKWRAGKGRGGKRGHYMRRVYCDHKLCGPFLHSRGYCVLYHKSCHPPAVTQWHAQELPPTHSHTVACNTKPAIHTMECKQPVAGNVHTYNTECISYLSTLWHAIERTHDLSQQTFTNDTPQQLATTTPPQTLDDQKRDSR